MLQVQERRTQLFSATMTNKVAKLQRACLIDPVKVEVAQKYSTVDTLRQQYLFIPAKYKVTAQPSHQLGCLTSLLMLSLFDMLTALISWLQFGCICSLNAFMELHGDHDMHHSPFQCVLQDW